MELAHCGVWSLRQQKAAVPDPPWSLRSSEGRQTKPRLNRAVTNVCSTVVGDSRCKTQKISRPADLPPEKPACRAGSNS